MSEKYLKELKLARKTGRPILAADGNLVFDDTQKFCPVQLDQKMSDDAKFMHMVEQLFSDVSVAAGGESFEESYDFGPEDKDPFGDRTPVSSVSETVRHAETGAELLAADFEQFEEFIKPEVEPPQPIQETSSPSPESSEEGST